MTCRAPILNKSPTHRSIAPELFIKLIYSHFRVVHLFVDPITVTVKFIYSSVKVETWCKTPADTSAINYHVKVKICCKTLIDSNAIIYIVKSDII